MENLITTSLKTKILLSCCQYEHVRKIQNFDSKEGSTMYVLFHYIYILANGFDFKRIQKTQRSSQKLIYWKGYLMKL